MEAEGKTIDEDHIHHLTKMINEYNMRPLTKFYLLECLNDTDCTPNINQMLRDLSDTAPPPPSSICSMLSDLHAAASKQSALKFID